MHTKSDKPEPQTFCPANPQEWRQWLIENHQSQQSVWLIYLKKTAGTPNLSWSEAVTEALCFGWIDSTAKSVDAEKYIQFFTRRKPKSVWSKVNKDKVELLIAQGKMAEAGYRSIATAKENGSWTSLDAVEALEMPEELAKAFAAQPTARDFYESLSRSARKKHFVLAGNGEARRNPEQAHCRDCGAGGAGKKAPSFLERVKAYSGVPRFRRRRRRALATASVPQFTCSFS